MAECTIKPSDSNHLNNEENLDNPGDNFPSENLASSLNWLQHNGNESFMVNNNFDIIRMTTQHSESPSFYLRLGALCMFQYSKIANFRLLI